MGTSGLGGSFTQNCEGLGPLCQAAGGDSPITPITAVISSVIGIMTIAAGIWFLFQFLVGGIGWISAGGDKNKLEAARNRITNAFIGLIIVVAGWAILALAGEFLGVNFVNPASILDATTVGSGGGGNPGFNQE